MEKDEALVEATGGAVREVRISRKLMQGQKHEEFLGGFNCKCTLTLFNYGHRLRQSIGWMARKLGISRPTAGTPVGAVQTLTPEPITVLLADDHALVRHGLRRILEDESCITVVGEASHGIEAVQLARRLKPRVVLMDCALPRIDGVLATRQIVQSCPKTLVLMLSMHSEEAWMRRGMEAGARGYILKSAMSLDLVSAIQRVVAGELVINLQVAERPVNTTTSEGGRLTTRELEILRWIVDGKSNKEIATQLGLSANTVATHRANIMKTLGFHKAAELVAYAIRSGLVPIL
jgi:DNA-binding NarL/FixJ family response regulator